MAGQVVAAASAASSTILIVCAKPAGTAAGDVMVAFHQSEWEALSAMTGPAGWTILTDLDPGPSNVKMRIWTHEAGADEPTDYTFGQGVGSSGTVTIVSTRGTAATFLHAINHEASGTTWDCPSLVGAQAGAVLLCGAMFEANQQSNAWTPPPGMTELADIQDSSGPWCTSTVASLLDPGDPTGVKTFTSSIAGFVDWGGIVASVVIQPAGGGPVQGAAALSASGTLAAAGKATSRAASTLTAAGGLAAAGLARSQAVAELSADADLAASATARAQAAATFTGDGTLGAAARSSARGMSVLTAGGALTASGLVRVQAPAALSGQATMTAAGRARTVAAVALTATSVLEVATGVIRGAASLTASATMAAAGRVRALGTTALSGESAITTAGRARSQAATGLSGIGSLGVAARVRALASAALSAVGNLIAAGTTPGAPQAEPPETAGEATLFGVRIAVAEVAMGESVSTLFALDTVATITVPAGNAQLTSPAATVQLIFQPPAVAGLVPKPRGMATVQAPKTGDATLHV